MLWSNILSLLLFFKAIFPNFGCKSTPIATGNKTCKDSFIITLVRSKSPPLVLIKIPIQTGVIKTPIILEREALKIAEVIFPLARDVITTDEETVDGNAAK